MNLNSVCRFKKTGPGHRVTERPTNFVSVNNIVNDKRPTEPIRPKVKNCLNS
jgi:hypothetical protein